MTGKASVGAGRKRAVSFLAAALCAVSANAQKLVSNGNFEGGYNSGWTHLAGNGSSAAYSAETASPYEGTNALKVVISTLGSNAWDVQTLGPSVSLTTGEDYTLTFWGKSASGSTSVRMVLQNTGYSAQSRALGASWAKHTWNFTAGEDTPQLKMHYYQTGTVWLDDIQIQPVVVVTNPPAGTNAVTVTLDEDTRRQTMVGFGGALSWYTTWMFYGSASNAAEIEQLMFEDSGIDVVRIKNWYYPDDPGVTASRNAASNLFHAAKQANSNIQVLCSSWSPPASLKSNGERPNGGTLKSDVNGFMYDELGQYWVEALDNMGWAPDYLSFQNEPGWVAAWDSCIFDPTQTVSNAGYAEASDAVWNAIKDRPNAPYMLGSEAENMPAFNTLNAPLLSRPYIAAHGYHIYDIGSEGAIDSGTTLSRLHNIRDSYGDRPNWMTEFSKDTFDWLEAARVLHNTICEANASAYIYWKLLWDDTSADTMIGVQVDGTYRVGPHYYMIKHYAKHVDMGYQRFEVTSDNADVKVSGFVSPDGTNVTVVLINKSTNITAAVSLGHSLPVVSAAGYQSVSNSFYQSMASLDIAQPVELPPYSLTTLVLVMSHTVNPPEQSLLEISNPAAVGSEFSLEVPDQAGAVFSLWGTSNLLSGPWYQITNAVQNGSGGVLTFTDPEPSAAQLFYRVRASR